MASPNATNRRSALRATAAALALLAMPRCVPGAIDIVNFESAIAAPFGALAPNPYLEGAYKFTAHGAQPLFVFTGTESSVASDGTKAASQPIHSPDIDLARIDGQAFSLLSLDIGELLIRRPDSTAKLVTFTGTLSGGGTVVASFVPDGIADGPGGVADFESFALPATFRNLLNVKITATGGVGDSGFQMDNLKLERVPEPASVAIWGMLGVCAALGGVARRRCTGLARR